MRMHDLGRLLTLVALVATATGCRDKSPPAKPDPVTSAAPAEAKSAKSLPTKSFDVAVVETDRIEIPRAFHDPVVLELPRVRGLRESSLDAAVNALLAPETILGQSIESVRADAKEVKKADDMPFGVQGSTFQIPYNRHGLLHVEASVELLGAYPSGSRFHLLVDLRTGKPIGPEAFLAARVPALVKRLGAEVTAELKAHPDAADLHLGETYESSELADVLIDDKGLTFLHDYGFPHAYLALQPDGRFFHDWAEIGADLDPAGPLARARP